MVIRGNTRGNGKQLAQYLMGGEANERVHIMDVAGRPNAQADYLHQTLQGMSLMSELTKSQKGLYHAQINPAYREDRKMTEKDWLKAADILGTELRLQGQRRVIVLHTKKGRTHAHVVWERYDNQTGKIISNSFSRLAQDRARKEMERVFEQAPTPHRNQHRPELKDAMTNLWSQTETGREFVKAVHNNGYLLAEGVPRHPFMVVDEQGRSFDLVRQLKGVRIKEVRQRLRHETLIPEKDAIELMRQKQEGSSEASQASRQRDLDNATQTVSAFWSNQQDTTQESRETQHQKRMKGLAKDFIQSGQDLTEAIDHIDHDERPTRRVGEYVLNADELTDKPGDAVEDENSPLRVDKYKDAWLEIIMTSQGQDDYISQLDAKPDKERYQDILKEFMHSGQELVDQAALVHEESKPHPQTSAQQFIENEEKEVAAFARAEEKALQELILEQKEIRERYRQRNKKRIR